MHRYVILLLCMRMNQVITSDGTLDISVNVRVNGSDPVAFNNSRNFNSDSCLRVSSSTIVHLEFARLCNISSIDITLYNTATNESWHNQTIQTSCHSEFVVGDIDYADGYYIIYRYHYFIIIA